MEASSAQQLKEKEPRVHRPYAFEKMEGLVREMQDPENGVPVRSQKQFLTSIPSAFMGYDLIEWLMERLNIEESVEAVHIANQLCQYGYFFPVNDSRTLTVKDDSSLYRFQTPYYWPWQHRTPDNVEYAIYLAKRTLRNKQRHGLEDYEVEALTSLKRNLQNKWDIIQLQAEEQIKLAKDRKKGDKIVSDSQERAFWRVYRPPPGCTSNLEVVPIPTRARPGLPRAPPRKRTLNDLNREVDLLRNSLTRTRVKVSVAIENLKTHFETFVEYDPLITQPQPSNPWISDDQYFWQLNQPLVEVPTEKRVKRWALSLEELMSDPTGLQEFTNYLRKEYSHENIRFYLAVKDLRHSQQALIAEKVNEIYKEFLAPGAPCEINIDSKTMEKTHQELKNPTRFTFDAAADHVYALLLKKDCYPRFIRSDNYRTLLTSGILPSQKKRFFNFGGPGKKKVASVTTPGPGNLQQQHSTIGSGPGGRRRGSDRSLSGSAHELAVCGVRDAVITPRVTHSHSQSNLTDIPYSRDSAESGIRPMDDVCPWDVPTTSSSFGGYASGSVETPVTGTSKVLGVSSTPPIQTAVSLEHHTSRKNSSQIDSCSSSSDASYAVTSEHHQHHHHQKIVPPQVQRHYSVGCTTSSRTKLADTRASVSSCTLISPQQSFDVTPLVEESRNKPQQPSQPIQSQSSTTSQKPTPAPTKTIAKAPLISICAIVGDLPEDEGEEPETDQDLGDSSSENAQMSGSVTIDQSMAEVEIDDTSKQQQVSREPKLVTQVSTGDSKQGSKDKEVQTSKEAAEETRIEITEDNDQKVKNESKDKDEAREKDQKQEKQQDKAQTAGTSGEQRDNKSNEVCPWEDEENCKVDAPYVKTYATLGYL